MIAADRPRSGARLLQLDARGGLHHAAAADLPLLLRRGDLVVANDAATLPASLAGVHVRTGGEIEVRLAGWSHSTPHCHGRRRPTTHDLFSRQEEKVVVGGPPSRTMTEMGLRFIAIVFGAGDYRTRTEDRALPPALRAGDVLQLGPLSAAVVRTLEHPRLIELRFAAHGAALWAGIARHGRAIQYAHVPQPLALWDVWTRIAGVPVAFEPPSAGFVLTWRMLAAFAERGIGFATLTHAAGISSTGDAELDKRLPFDEAYVIPQATVAAIRKTRAEGGRVVAIGTSVVRALEHAAKDGALREGAGVATGRIESATRLKLVDAIVSGVHAPGESHHALLRAFTCDTALANMAEVLEIGGFRNHEFGDFVLIERSVRSVAGGQIAGAASRVRYLPHGQQEGLRS